MEKINLHKQKLYALIVAGLALIAIFLPWATANLGGIYGMYGGGHYSNNGFRSWGILSLLGIAGVLIASLMGDKTKEYDQTFKMVAMASFGAIAVGAIVYFIRLSSVGHGVYKTGFGVWIAIVAGLAGLAWVAGLVKMPENKPPAAPPKA